MTWNDVGMWLVFGLGVVILLLILFAGCIYITLWVATLIDDADREKYRGK